MFKKISLFLVLALVITTLSACASSGISKPVLTKEKKGELENGWYDWITSEQYSLKWYGDEGVTDYGIRYYGNFSGYDIIFQPSGLTVLDGVTIGGVQFKGTSSFKLYACKSGYFAELKQLYEESGISTEEISDIAKIHNGDPADWPTADAETRAVFRHEWAKHYYGMVWNDKADQPYNARYYGNVEGYDILYVVLRVPPDCADYREYTIGETKFEDDCSANIYGYLDGKLTFVRNLYEEGSLSAEAVEEIAKVHRMYEK